MSNELLEKVVQTTTLGSDTQAGTNGLLTAEQSNRFIDYMWDATVLGQQVRSIRMRSDTIEINKIGVGTRLLRKATEAVDTGVNAEATFSKISLTTVKLRLDFELSSESLEDNIEGDALEDHVARLMATQAGNDLEDVAINGDTNSSDLLLKSFDGWAKRADDAAHIVDHGGLTIDRSVFNKALKAMPRKYLARRNGLKFFTDSNLVQDYIFSQQVNSPAYVTPESIAAAGINRAVAPEGPAGFTTGAAFGVTIQEVPLMDSSQDGYGYTGPHGDVWLTFPDNLLLGIKREIVVYREFKPKKDTIEYTMYTRVGTQIENGDAFVVVRNVKVSV